MKTINNPINDMMKPSKYFLYPCNSSFLLKRNEYIKALNIKEKYNKKPINPISKIALK